MTSVSRSEFAAIKRQLSAKKKARRQEKRATLPWGKRPQVQGTIKKVINKTDLKEAIVYLLGRLDAKVNGPECRIHGGHKGEVAYHLIPQGRGDAARFIPENVVWACSDANFGEKNNRSLYRDKHIQIFGKERIERIEAAARGIRKYSTEELLELRDNIKAKLEGRSWEAVPDVAPRVTWDAADSDRQRFQAQYPGMEWRITFGAGVYQLEWRSA